MILDILNHRIEDYKFKLRINVLCFQNSINSWYVLALSQKRPEFAEEECECSRRYILPKTT